MKIANSKYYGVLAVSVAGALLLATTPVAWAQTTVTELAIASSAATMAATAAPVPMPPSPPGIGQPSDAAEAEADASKKIPGQVTDIVKKLQDAKVDLSLEDMNQARGALARLDLLLELEQKMGDLDKVRAKRTAAESMAEEVSALLPRGVARMPGRANAVPGDAAPVVTPAVLRVQPVAGGYTVQRINGVDGNYTAMLSDANDEKTSVHVGDKLSDGSTVTGITASTVQLRGPNAKTDHTLRVNNGSPMNHGRRAP